jgi:hypothetical protein
MGKIKFGVHKNVEKVMDIQKKTAILYKVIAILNYNMYLMRNIHKFVHAANLWQAKHRLLIVYLIN